METNRELITLRVSVARVAQAAGVSLARVGLTDDAEYRSIHKAAIEHPRGWNGLCAEVAEHLDLLRRQMERDTAK
jgi:hypothetical protein